MEKWLAIGLIGLVFGMFSPLIVSEYGRTECRVEALKSQRSAEEIIKICK